MKMDDKQKKWLTIGGAGIICLILVVLIAGMELDVTGFERRVPEAGQVTAVRIRNVSSAPYDRGDGRDYVRRQL